MMMSRMLLVFLAVECVVCIAYFGHQVMHPVALLPSVVFDDPLAEAELRELANEATRGGRRAWSEFASDLLGQGFYGEAEHAFRATLTEDPQDYMAHFGLAFCLDRTGRTKVATQEYVRAAKIDQRSELLIGSTEHCLYQAGKNDLREENEASAIERFELIQDFSPAAYQVAKLQIRSGNVDKAMPAINEILKRAPNSLKFNSLLLQASEMMGQKDKSLEAAEMLERSEYFVPTDLNTNYVKPLSQRVVIGRRLATYNRLLETDDMDAMSVALAEIWESIKDTALLERSMILMSMTEVEFQRRQPEKILQAVARLKAMGINNAEMLQMEGAAFALQGNLDDAAEVWLRASRMAPNIPLHQMLARYYARTNNEASERHHLAQAALLQTKTEYWSNKMIPAREAVIRAIELDESLDQAWFYLGRIESVLGNREKAIEAYQMCLQKNPNHGRALEAVGSN